MNLKVGNKRLGIIVLLALCYLVLYMDRSNMSMAGSSMMKYYNWSATEFGLVSTAFFIGYAITQMPGGRLADKFGGGKIVMFGALTWSVWIIQTWNWQMVFHTFAFLGPVWVVIWWKFGKDTPAQHSKITKQELEYIHADQGSQRYQNQNGGILTKKEILSTKSVWFCALSYFCANYLFFLFMTWLPTYFVNGRGLNLQSSSLYSMLPYLVNILAPWVKGNQCRSCSYTDFSIQWVFNSYDGRIFYYANGLFSKKCRYDNRRLYYSWNCSRNPGPVCDRLYH
jgi:sugar phosphate permease